MVTMFVLTTKKHQERTNAQEQTFLGWFPHWYLTDEFGKGRIKTTNNDTYSSQVEKWYWFFRNFNCLDVDTPMTMLIDDDTFVNRKALGEFVQSLGPMSIPSSLKIHGQILSKETDPQNDIFAKVQIKDFKYHSGGAGILFSTRFLQTFSTLVNEANLAPFSPYCDVMLGAYLDCLSDDYLVNHSGFHSQPPSKYGHSDEDIRKSITYHYIKPHQMSELEDICGK